MTSHNIIYCNKRASYNILLYIASFLFCIVWYHAKILNTNPLRKRFWRPLLAMMEVWWFPTSHGGTPIAGWFISWKIVLPCHHFRNPPYFAKTVSTCCKGTEWSSQCAMWRLLIFFWVAIDIPTIIFRNSPLILGHLIPFIVISPKISTIKKDEFHSHIVPHSYMAKSMEISIINVN